MILRYLEGFFILLFFMLWKKHSLLCNKNLPEVPFYNLGTYCSPYRVHQSRCTVYFLIARKKMSSVGCCNYRLLIFSNRWYLIYFGAVGWQHHKFRYSPLCDLYNTYVIFCTSIVSYSLNMNAICYKWIQIQCKQIEN